MDTLAAVMFFALGGNLFFTRGIGLEILSSPEEMTIPRLFRHGLWILLVGAALSAVGLLLPGEVVWLQSLLLPALALLLWGIAANVAPSSSTWPFFLVQSAALGTAYLALLSPSWWETFLTVFFSALGYVLALFLYREVLRFVPANMPPARRFSLLMLSLMVGSIGFLLFGIGNPSA